MDRHGLFLRGRVDGLRDRVGELEQAVLVRNGRTNERLLALELEITGAELTPVAGEVEAGLLLRDRPVDGDERIARLEARLAQLEARLEEQGAGRAHDDERLDDFLVLVGCAFESLALGSERLRFKNPR
jgi:hypothetical protein